MISHFTLAGLAIGVLVGVLGETQKFLLVATLGGILGFLIGWMLNTRSGAIKRKRPHQS